MMTRAGLLLLCAGASGCVLLYLPGAPAPGRMAPAARPGEWDIAFDLDLGRTTNLGAKVKEGSPGQITPDSSLPPFWPGLNLNVRFGLIDGLGLELRGGTSLLLPIPFPIPNTLGLAPVVRIADLGNGIQVHTSPRALLIAGALAAAGPSTSLKTEALSPGLELPVLVGWSPADWFQANGTLFGRGFLVAMKTVHNGVETQASWLSAGFGGTLNAIFTLGVFRLALGIGAEAMPNPAGGTNPCQPGQTACTQPPGYFFVPQGGLSLGVAWK